MSTMGKQHKTEDGDDASSVSASSKDEDRGDRNEHKRKHKDDRKKKKEKRKRSRPRRSCSSSSDDASDEDERKSSRKEMRKESDQSVSSYSSDNSDSSEDRRSKKKKKRRHKHSAKKKKKKKRDKKKKNQKSSKDGLQDDAPYFGKYGILKASDYHKQQRSFTVWLEEVKGIMSFNGPKWELQNYFKEYMEDYNTATLPHNKYYDYDKWEMEEYQKNKAANAASQKSSAQRDEALHMQTLQEKAKAKRQEELNLMRNMMSKEKREEMKRKADLQAQMAHAYKIGDQETYLRLKSRIEPDK